MKTLKKIKLFILTLILISFYSCSNSETDSNIVEGIAPKISIRLVDAPGDFKAVNVEVVDVREATAEEIAHGHAHGVGGHHH